MYSPYCLFIVYSRNDTCETPWWYKENADRAPYSSLFDDWGLINEECWHNILGDLGANNKTKSAHRLIDYFHDNHIGEELLHFCQQKKQKK